MAAPSREVYKSSATLISCYHVTRRELIYGDLVSPATMKHVGGSIRFRPDIQRPRQMQNALRDI